jgi:hypothetical protein
MFLQRHTSNVGFQTLRFEKIREKSCSVVIDVYEKEKKKKNGKKMKKK